MNSFKLVNTEQVYFVMHVWLPWWMPRLHDACKGLSHHWAEIFFYSYSIDFEDLAPCLTGLTGPYSEIVQELTN